MFIDPCAISSFFPTFLEKDFTVQTTFADRTHPGPVLSDPIYQNNNWPSLTMALFISLILSKKQQLSCCTGSQLWAPCPRIQIQGIRVAGGSSGAHGDKVAAGGQLHSFSCTAYVSVIRPFMTATSAFDWIVSNAEWISCCIYLVKGMHKCTNTVKSASCIHVSCKKKKIPSGKNYSPICQY